MTGLEKCLNSVCFSSTPWDDIAPHLSLAATCFKERGQTFLNIKKISQWRWSTFSIRTFSNTLYWQQQNVTSNICITVVKHFPVYILPTNYSVQQLLLEGTGVRPRRKVWIFQRFCLTSQAMDECLHVWPKLESLQMRATMSAEGNLSCFELVGVPLEAIGTSRLVIEPMAITSIVQLDDGTLCHLGS